MYGEWQSVRPLGQDQVLVMPGHTLEYALCGLLPAAQHRVVSFAHVILLTHPKHAVVACRVRMYQEVPSLEVVAACRLLIASMQCSSVQGGVAPGLTWATALAVIGCCESKRVHMCLSVCLKSSSDCAVQACCSCERLG